MMAGGGFSESSYESLGRSLFYLTISFSPFSFFFFSFESLLRLKWIDSIGCPEGSGPEGTYTQTP